MRRVGNWEISSVHTVPPHTGCGIGIVGEGSQRGRFGDGHSSSWESAKRKLASRVASSRSSSALQVLKVIRAPGPFLGPDTAFTTASTVWQGVLEKGSRVLERASSPTRVVVLSSSVE